MLIIIILIIMHTIHIYINFIPLLFFVCFFLSFPIFLSMFPSPLPSAFFFLFLYTFLQVTSIIYLLFFITLQCYIPFLSIILEKISMLSLFFFNYSLKCTNLTNFFSRFALSHTLFSLAFFLSALYI